MKQFKFKWVSPDGVSKSKKIEAADLEQAKFLFNFYIGKPVNAEVEEVREPIESLFDQLRFHHAESLRCISLFQESDVPENKERFRLMYAQEQLEIMQLHKLHLAL
jgi:hypothetical protein